MAVEIQQLAQQLRERGQRQFGVWNDAAFDSYVAGPVGNLARSLASQDKAKADGSSLTNFLQLVYEGVGAGWLGPIEPEVPPLTFLAHCLAMLIPYQLRNVPRQERSEVLKRVWNLGEGLAREPQWLNQYAIARTDWSTDPRQLDKHLASILGPVLSPLPPATWRGKFELQVLNLRGWNEAFVPGRMYLASPAVLCVEGRVGGDTLALLLQKGGKSEVFGSVSRLPEHLESFSPPPIRAQPNSIQINGHDVAAPLISAPRQTLCAASGFVVVSADDSQRLWLVESE
jgi:hypothetical protein